jgi:hypothetical protein
MDSLWVFLVHAGVEPTNNRGKRALRFGVQWRKRSLGTASDKGNRWVERILSLKETCRLRSVSTYQVLVDAVSSFFHGQQPDLRLAPVEIKILKFRPCDRVPPPMGGNSPSGAL